MNRSILVDADGLPYIAAVSDKRSYRAVFEDGKGRLVDISVDSAAEVAEFQEERPDLTLLDRELVVTPGPVHHQFQVIKKKLAEIKRRYPGDLEVYIKGEGNFREEVATIHGYKANRKDVPRPHWINELYEYLREVHNAIPCNGKEADDQIATRAYESSRPYVVCSPDKDLDQIPGLHWNYSKQVEYTVSPEEAREFFWTQVVVGDPADNIKGCWKFGLGAAAKVIPDLLYEDNLDDAAMWAWVVSVYEDSMGKPSCPYAGMPAELVALENARLVWMQTEAGRLWTPPNAEKEYLEATLDD